MSLVGAFAHEAGTYGVPFLIIGEAEVISPAAPVG